MANLSSNISFSGAWGRCFWVFFFFFFEKGGWGGHKDDDMVIRRVTLLVLILADISALYIIPLYQLIWYVFFYYYFISIKLLTYKCRLDFSYLILVLMFSKKKSKFFHICLHINHILGSICQKLEMEVSIAPWELKEAYWSHRSNVEGFKYLL